METVVGHTIETKKKYKMEATGDRNPLEIYFGVKTSFTHYDLPVWCVSVI